MTKPAFTPEDWREVLPAEVANPHQTMALANASLPDDDPRKITRVDVDFLELAALDLEDDWGPNAPNALRVMAIAKKLAALLPPSQHSSP